MANVSIKFNGKEFLLSCDDGQEEHLEELLIQINQKFNDLKNNLGNLGENKLLLITAVKVMDEYYETKKKVEQKRIELKDLSNKFKELKSLIYEYRDRKEKEIKELNDNHNEILVMEKEKPYPVKVAENKKPGKYKSKDGVHICFSGIVIDKPKYKYIVDKLFDYEKINEIIEQECEIVPSNLPDNTVLDSN